MAQELNIQPSQTSTYEGPTSPMSTKEWLITYLLLMIPFANFIFMIIWAIGGPNVNINKRNMFRASWIMTGIVFAIYIVILIVFGVVMGAAVKSMM